jgi:hypothetical protein
MVFNPTFVRAELGRPALGNGSSAILATDNESIGTAHGIRFWRFGLKSDGRNGSKRYPFLFRNG